MWLPLHRILIPLCLLLILLTAVLSRYLPKRFTRITGQVFVILLLLSEGLKHLEGLLLSAYAPLYYPFHYSSTYYVSLSLYCFGRGKVRHYGACTLFVGGLFLLATLLYSPLAVVGDPALLGKRYFALHGFVYHMAVLAFWAVMLANRNYRPRPQDPLRYLTFLLAWALPATVAARRTGANYAGLLQSWIPPLEALRLRAGDAVYLSVYGLFIMLIAALAIRLYARLNQRRG